MTTPQIIVTFSGLLLSAFVAWFFWFAPRGRLHATAGTSGLQEASITVKGGYSPDFIVVKAGQPVRFTFTRQESASCSEQVIFSDFGQSAQLPEGEPVAIEFTPDKPGEYEFHCQMGMLRGKLLVE